MYQNKIELTPQDILEKEFKVDIRGYSPREVDQYLDTIIGDYEHFYEIIKNLEEEKSSLMNEIMKLKQELRNSKLSMEVARSNINVSEVTNMDIIYRLSNLEKMVYGNKNKESNSEEKLDTKKEDK